ncbi:MAG: hypothetical protein KJZ77_06635 [Anaerolineales bacterium]|nr:hypothetical protein [Anaerolineales bacterium]
MKRNLSLFLLLVLSACTMTTTAPPVVPATASPAPTILPTITPTPTPIPNGPCDSPLLPLTAGNAWTYRVTSAGGESLFDLRSLKVEEKANIIATVEFTDRKNNVTVTEPVVCVDGGVENFPLFVVSMIFSDYLEEDFNTYHDTGMYAPSYQLFLENDWTMNWEVNYLTEDQAHVKNPLGGQSLYVLESSFIDLSFATDGTREAVTVPAGEYPQVLKVQHTFSFPATLFLPTGTAGSFITVYVTQWYEPFVGLVRAEVDRTTIFFSAQEMEMPIVSTVEMVEFRKGE